MVRQSMRRIIATLLSVMMVAGTGTVNVFADETNTVIVEGSSSLDGANTVIVEGSSSLDGKNTVIVEGSSSLEDAKSVVIDGITGEITVADEPQQAKCTCDPVPGLSGNMPHLPNCPTLPVEVGELMKLIDSLPTADEITDETTPEDRAVFADDFAVVMDAYADVLDTVKEMTEDKLTALLGTERMSKLAALMGKLTAAATLENTQKGAVINKALDFTSIAAPANCTKVGHNHADPADYCFTWDRGSKTLTLNGLNLVAPDGGAAVKLPDGTTVVTAADSSITSGKGRGTYGDYCDAIAISSAGALIFDGSGKLELTADDSASGSCRGLNCKDLTVKENARLVATSGASGGSYGSSYGINVLGSADISGDVTATGGTSAENYSYGIYVNNNTNISGKVTATGGTAVKRDSGGMNCYGETVITGTVDAIGGNGLTSFGIRGPASLNVNGGTVTATGGENARASYGIYCYNGGSINVISGTVTATGGTNAGTSQGIRYSSINVIGGTLVASTDCANSAQAVSTVPNGYVEVASKKSDGSEPEKYYSSNIADYKYLKVTKTFQAAQALDFTSGTAPANCLAIGHTHDDSADYCFTWGSNTLTLKGLDLTAPDGSEFAIKLPDGAKVDVSNDNTVKCGKVAAEQNIGCGIYGVGALSFSGSGMLNVTGSTQKAYSQVINSYGIYSVGGLVVDGTVTLNAIGGSVNNDSSNANTNTNASYGICVKTGDVTINSGTVNAKATTQYIGYGIAALTGDINVKGGTLNAVGNTSTSTLSDQSYGAYAGNGNINVSGGTLNATGDRAAGNGSSYGAKGTAIKVSGAGKMNAQGGEIRDDRATSYGVHGSVTVSGSGKLTAQGGDGDDKATNSYGVYGSVAVNDTGNLVAVGGAVTAAGYGIFAPTDADTITVTGGTMDATTMGNVATAQAVNKAPSTTQTVMAGTTLSGGMVTFAASDIANYKHVKVLGVAATGNSIEQALDFSATDSATTLANCNMVGHTHANAADYCFTWDGSKLTLNNLNLTSPANSGFGIKLPNDTVTIESKEGTENYVTCGNSTNAYGIQGEGDLINYTFTGTGKLTVRGGESAEQSYGIFLESNVTTEMFIDGGCTLTAIGGKSTQSSSYADSRGILTAANITVVNGTLNAEGGSSLLGSTGISHGSNYNLTFTVKDKGTLNAKGGNSIGGVEGTSYGINNYSYSCAVIVDGGGTLTATGGTSYSGYSYGVYAETITNNGTLTAMGGTSYSGSSYGVSAGTITNKGTLTATGGNASQFSTGASTGKVTVDGGTLTATGANVYTDGSRGIYCGSTTKDAVTVNDGTLKATGGSCGIYTSATKDTVTVKGGTLEASATGATAQAVSRAPVTTDYAGSVITASTGLTGAMGAFVPGSIGTYKRVRVGVDSTKVVSALDFTKDDAPANCNSLATSKHTHADEKDCCFTWVGGTDKKLTLNKLNLVAPDGSEFGIKLPYNAAVVTTANTANSVTGGKIATTGASYGISSDGDVTFSGTGTLTVNGGAATSGTSYGISIGKLILSSGTVTANGGAGANSYGIYGKATSTDKNIDVQGGTLTATGGTSSGNSVGIDGGANGCLINGGTVTAKGGAGAKSYGICGDAASIITGGTLEASATGTIAQAVTKAPVTTGYPGGAKFTASKNSDGSTPEASYDAKNLADYKYLKVMPNPPVLTEISYDKTEYTFGDALPVLTAPVFSRPGTVTYAAVPADVVTLNTTTGAITAFLKAGEVTITTTNKPTDVTVADATSKVTLTVKEGTPVLNAADIDIIAGISRDVIISTVNSEHFKLVGTTLPTVAKDTDTNNIIDSIGTVTKTTDGWKVSVKLKSTATVGQTATIAINLPAVTGKLNAAAKKTITVTVKGKSALTVENPTTTVTYNGSAQAFAGTVKAGSQTLTAGATTNGYTASYYDAKGTLVASPTNAGTYNVVIVPDTATAVEYTPVGKATGSDYTLVIKPKEITPVITVTGSYTYNNTQQQATVTVEDGSTELAASDYDVAYGDNIDAGKGNVHVTLKGNYSGYSTQSFDIAAASVAIAVDAKSKKYGESDPKFTYTATPKLYDGDTMEGSLTRTAGEKPGTYEITGTLTNSNYIITATTPANLTITKADVELIVSVNPAIVVKGGTATVTVTAKNAIAAPITDAALPVAPTLTVVTENVALTHKGNGVYEATYTNTDKVGDIVFSAACAGDANYNAPSTKTTVLSVSDKTLVTITGVTAPANRIYTGKPVADSDFGTATLTPAIAGVTPEYVYYNDTEKLDAAPKDAGSYTLVVKLPDSNATHIGRVEVPFTIGKATLTVTADNKDMYQYYDLPKTTFTYNGFVPGESESVLTDNTLSAVHTAVNSQMAGRYSINITGGTTASNYELTTNDGTLTIIEKKLSPPATEVIEPSADTPTVGIPPASIPDGADLSKIRLVVYRTLTKEDTDKVDDHIEGNSAFANNEVYEISLVDEAKNNAIVQPNGTITICIPYPAGSSIKDTFTLLHVKSDNSVETIIPEKIPEGLKFDVSSLSPFAIGWVKHEDKPIVSNRSDDSDDYDYQFWMTVKKKINNSAKGDIVKVTANSYDQMPASVMTAMLENGVGTVISWNGGKTITIPAGKALKPETGRLFFPLSLLEQKFGGVELVNTGVNPQNPETGGYGYYDTTAGSVTPVTGDVLEVPAAPAIVNPAGTTADAPIVVTPPTAGIDPEVAAASTGSNMTFAVIAAMMAALAGGIWFYRRKYGTK